MKALENGHLTWEGCHTMDAFPKASWDLLFLHEQLKPEERAVQLNVRAFAEQELAPRVADLWERAAFPFDLLPKLAALNVVGGTLKGYGCPGLSPTAFGMVMAELARVDCGMSTFLLAHSSLAMATIFFLGSEQHKQQLLPAMARLQLIGAWALTEPNNGSDASGLTTTACRVSGGWQLNGYKRWIGNATIADVIVVWARNSETNQVNAFLVRKGAPGYTATKIERKASHRIMQNGNVTLKDVFIADEDHLPGADSFQATAHVLAISRVMVGWQPVGIAAGVYDMALRYTLQRKQFGAALAQYQISQEKLVRMLGSVQAMFLTSLQLTRVYESGRMSPGMAALVKAWNSLKGREVVALGRELLGSNGLLAEFLVAKAFNDMEGVYSYEGTYEVNALVAGREVTGLAAFKALTGSKSTQEQGLQLPSAARISKL